MAFNSAHGYKYKFVAGGDGEPKVVVFKAGVELGTPIRFKCNSANQIAADFPGVDPNTFVTNGDHGGPGSITNG